MCRPNGTLPYCPAVQCRPPDRPRARAGGGPRTTVHARYRRRQTTPTDDSVQNDTGPLGGPVIKLLHVEVKVGQKIRLT